MFDLSGKHALVTGASGGIGGAIARALHGAGAKVVLAGRRAEPLQALKSELGELDKVDQLFKDAEAAYGQLDILVNNAGFTRDGLAMRMKDEDWQKVLD